MKTAKNYLDEANAVVKKIDFDAALQNTTQNQLYSSMSEIVVTLQRQVR